VQRDFELYLNDIKHFCEKILKYTKSMSQDQFIKDEMAYDAVLRNLLIIGEAAKNLPDNRRKDYSLVEWKKICGFKDIIAHAYFGIDNTILWDIIQSKIPTLLKALNN
jgi:uncharacterized protein with HEPN domain